MKPRSLSILIAFMLVVSPGLFAAEAVKGFATDSLVLYQTDPVLRERAPSVEELTGYIKRLQGVCGTFFATADKPETLHVVVALKPGKQSRVWFLSSTRSTGDKELEPLRRQLEAVTPIEVRQGPVLFAISAKIAGGDGKDLGMPPIPREWKDAAKSKGKEVAEPEELLAIVWPDAVSGPAKATPAPIEFVTQVLEPTGGKIERPKDWIYVEGHRNSVYMWTISREGSSNGQPYETGIRIQAVVGIKEKTGTSAKDFILAFLEKKKASAKVLSTCDEQDQGMFTRICIETEEGPHHVQYSLFWGNHATDIAVIVTSGTTKELWDAYSPIFARMSVFELVDMARFEKQR